ncbi:MULTISPECIES: LysR family transcriptional regulator [unclassified Rhizobium]|uniref:LysR family transcriptional regulator n=1 Tax=Rhizobium TaxID=379 RepID=UPI00084CB952|nr:MULTISPECIES: LysR family transcriptional regulator [unclassified Rhizobium]OEC93865.1 LysR family transcriptional regulator [Rhizobium sp. YK2]QYA15968.1 LysR family transcriptional regulator [Rhizobium sp. AB2/73]UEQ84511.1 LysR family transcriptional regulator [Rhizobium sp. AB2/73]
MDTNDVLIFTTAVSAGSLAAAARRLGLTPMIASRRLASLEASLGVRLLHRTTRSLSLTPEGESFLPFAQALVDNENAALALLHSGVTGAAGLLRVSVPISFGIKFVMPMVPKLLDDNPELRVSVDMTDSLPDLVATGTDLAIRIARLRDSSLIAQKLADNPRLVVASPDYLARRGKPASLSELANHDCLALGNATHWTFQTADGEKHAKLGGRFSSNSIAGCYTACLAGGGLALLSNWYASDDIKAGRLVWVDFQGARPDTIHIWAVYPTSRLVLPKVRVFISALRAALAAAGLRNSNSIG